MEGVSVWTRPAPGPNARDSGWLARTLDRLLDHLRALLPIDGSAYFVLGDGGSIEPVARWLASPDLGEALVHSDIADLAFERERALLLPRVEAWEAAPELRARLERALGEHRAGRVWSEYGKASVIACPVRAPLGRTLGVLVAATLDPKRPLSSVGLRTVEVLADLSALALERAELLDAEGRRARQELQLKRASEAMSGSLELDEVYRCVVDHAAALTAASAAFLTRLQSRSGELRVAAATGFPDGFAPRRFPAGSGEVGDVARTRRPLLGGPLEAAGAASSAHAPIELGPRLFGVLSICDGRADGLDEEDLELLVKLARSSAAAIANAIDYQRERRIARALTLGFVPESLPEVPGYDTGLLYAPSANEPTGGDLYGAWRLPGGEVAVLVGDVAGKGVETAALSAMARFFIEARSFDSTCPAEILAQANAMLAPRLPSDTFVTAFLALVTPAGLRYSNAGHLPPLHVSGGAPAALARHGLPLGVQDEATYGSAELELLPGDVVFAFTDGLVEARRDGEMFGDERLAALVAARSGGAGVEELVRTAHEEASAWAGGLSDDAVALALRRRPD